LINGKEEPQFVSVPLNKLVVLLGSTPVESIMSSSNKYKKYLEDNQEKLANPRIKQLGQDLSSVRIKSFYGSSKENSEKLLGNSTETCVAEIKSDNFQPMGNQGNQQNLSVASALLKLFPEKTAAKLQQMITYSTIKTPVQMSNPKLQKTFNLPNDDN